MNVLTSFLPLFVAAQRAIRDLYHMCMYAQRKKTSGYRRKLKQFQSELKRFPILTFPSHP
jgi:hypothetical protein